MDEVARSRLTVSDVDRFAYHRLNADYKQLHKLCRLFLERKALSEALGETTFEGFVLDMNDVFERYVTEELRRLMRGWEVTDQEHSHLARKMSGVLATDEIEIVPDLVLRQATQVRAILDCKFKQTSDESYKNFDFYQVLAYCTAFNTKRGGLIYPRSEGLQGDAIEVVHSSGVQIRRFVVDLDQHPDGLQRSMEDLGSAVMKWAAS